MLQQLLLQAQQRSSAACLCGSGAGAAAAAAQRMLLHSIAGSSWSLRDAATQPPPAAAGACWRRQHLPGSSGEAPAWQLQQQRGAAKKAKTQATAKGKKGVQAPKKATKQRMESKPFDAGDPLNQKLVAMLVPAAEPLPRSAAAQAELLARHKEFSRQRMQEHKAWKADLNAKLALKKAAISALPPDLRTAALQEDLAGFPLTRHFYYDTPPDAYVDKE